MLESVAGEVPTHGAVAQSDHAILDACVDQGLGADNAARAPGAIDDHQSIRGWREVVNTVGELCTGNADAVGNVAGVVLDHGATVEDHHILVLVHHLFQLVGGHRRRLVLELDILSERLAGDVDAAEYFQPCCPPGFDTAIEHTDILIVEGQKSLRGALCEPFTAVANDDLRRSARNHDVGEKLQAAERHAARVKNVCLTEAQLFACIQQRDLTLALEQLVELGCADKPATARYVCHCFLTCSLNTC